MAFRKFLTLASATFLSFGLSGCSYDSTTILIDRGDRGDGIIGGEAVVPGDSIYATTVLVIDLHNGDTCTGSLIDARWVVTAAHCARGKIARDFIIGFGTSDVDIITHPTPDNRRSVEAVIVHPEFEAVAQKIEALQKAAEAQGRDLDFKDLDQIRDWNDVALLKMTSDSPAGHHAIDLPPMNFALQIGESVEVAGFGRADAKKPGSAGLLRKTELPVEQVTWGRNEILLDQHGGRAVCNGDSGGPVIAQSQTTAVIVGVTSRGVGDNGGGNGEFCSHSTAVTSLIAYRAWIREQTGL